MYFFFFANKLMFAFTRLNIMYFMIKKFIGIIDNEYNQDITYNILEINEFI